MKAIIEPSVAKGTVKAPPSKSMAHRMLICAGLSDKESIIKGIVPSKDVLATLDCLSAIGAEYTYEDNCVKIRGRAPVYSKNGYCFKCRECGSTLRFFIPLALLTDSDCVFTGSETLMKRPLSVYEDIARKNNFVFEKNSDGLIVKGQLEADTYKIRGDISSQFISGLLFALPLVENDSRIELIPPVESRSYINMTLQALRMFGIKAAWEGENVISVKGGQRYGSIEGEVEGDYSNAAFLEALNLIGGSVKVTGLDRESLQGDKVYEDYFEKIKKGNAQLDIADCPDLGPVLFAAAAILGGAGFTGTKRLRIKESDRAQAMKEELSKFGIRMDVGENTAEVFKGSLKRPEEILLGHNDHRIVMALSVIAVKTGAVIDGAEAVSKSFPDFFDVLRELKIEVRTDGMDK